LFISKLYKKNNEIETKENPQQQQQPQRGFIFLEAFVAIKRVLYLQHTILFLAAGFHVSLLGHLLRGPDRRCLAFRKGLAKKLM